MKKQSIFFCILTIVLLSIVTGCSLTNEKPTISINTDSSYVKTFEDLNLGILYNFKFRLPNADKSWVNIWVERYEDGVRSPDPITQLSYGLSQNNIDEGDMGFGIIDHVKESPSVFLYAPSVKSHTETIEKIHNPNPIKAGDYAFEGNLELEYDQPYLLAVYRESKGNSIRSGYVYQDEQEVEELIDEHSLIYLLKIKVEEK